MGLLLSLDSGAPAIPLVGNGRFAPSVSFARASSGTVFASDGVTLINLATGQPRFNGAAGRLLVEGARTNVALQSQQQWASPWTVGTSTQSTVLAPDGTQTATQIVCQAGVSSNQNYQTTTVTENTAYVYSLYVKLDTLPVGDYKSGFYNQTSFNFIAQDILPVAPPVPGQWSRVSFPVITPAGCTSLRVYNLRNNNPVSGGVAHVWGAQLEAGAFASSYIPTTTAAATRAPDVAAFDLPLAYRQQGTIVASVVFSGLDTNQALFTLDDGTTNNRVGVRYGTSGSLTCYRTVAGSTTFGTVPGTIQAGRVHKVAMTWDASGVSFSLDGGTIYTYNSLPVVNRGLIGRDTSGFYLYGEIGPVVLRQSRVSDAQLRSLSS